MEPVNKSSQTKCSTQNPGICTRTNRCYDEDDKSAASKYNKCSEAYRFSSLHHGTWPVKRDTWTGQQINYTDQQTNSSTSYNEMATVVNHLTESGCSDSMQGHRRLGAKVDVVYSLLGMLSSSEGREDMSSTLLAMSNSIDSCLIMRQSGCLPLLIQLIHANGQNPETRERAARALHNVIHARNDEKIGRREARVLRLLEQVRDYCQMLRMSLKLERPLDDLERHPGPTIAALMKLSFDEAHRHAMCQLGGLHAVTELIEMDHAAHGSDSDDQSCITLRRYAGMALTNLTFGDGNNKALLCSFREFMKALVSQLRSMSDDLRQVTASVLRNLSWRADSSSKQTLREVGAVTALMKAAMEGRKESTLKSILSALWNLSAHCSTNKVDICAVDGALAFLVDMLSYKAPSKTLSIVENAGGILRNVSSHIAVREDYRVIVRERGCLQVLLRQLRSPSLTVVSNACGTLWNLSARCPHDQRLLWDLGAVPMLRSLVHSKHKMISMGSSAALKNLLNARPCGSNLVHLDSTARGLGLPTLPSLVVRRQRALEQEIDQNLSETCDNIEPSTSPTNKDDKFSFKIEPNFEDLTLQRKTYQNQNNQLDVLQKTNQVSRSESKESMRSITSTHSDTIFERVNRHISNDLTPTELQNKQQSSSLHSAMSVNNHGILDIHNKMNQLEKRYALQYKNIIPEQMRFMEIDVNDRNMRSITSTISWTIAEDQKSQCSLMRSSVKDKLSPTESVDQATSKTTSDFEVFAHQEIASNSSQNNLNKNTAPQTYRNKTQFLHTSNHKTETHLFGDYAETDLDEPTNYSLRYAERNSDEDEKPRLEYLLESEQAVEDTLKTYYTEGTPRETSLSSSRAASQSDLQYDKIKQMPGKMDSEKVDNDEDFQYYLKSNMANGIGKKMLECHKKTISSNSGPSNTAHQSSTINSNHSQNFFEIQIDSQNGKNTDVKKSIITIDTSATNINLAINGEPKIINDSYANELRAIKKQNGMIESESLTESTASDGDDDDEDLLAACIHIGMQNNRHMQSYRKNIPDNLEINDTTNCYHSGTSDYQPTNFNIKISTETGGNNNEKIEYYDNQEPNTIANKQSCSNKITINFTDKSNENNVNEKMTNETPLLQTESSESIESYDSVERSEQVLLELCIKSGSTANENNISNKEIDFPSKIPQLNNLAREIPTSKETQNVENVTDDVKNAVVEEYRRQRDPDAMIASLDRLTATLVQQTEAMREKEMISMKQSILSDTWNEDSPNDSSFPTISMSVPLIASFKSDIQEDSTPTLPSSTEETDALISIKTSQIIKDEALKVAEAMKTEFQETNQVTQNIDDIKPPSAMNSLLSLTTSFIAIESTDEFGNQDRNSTSLPPTLLKSRMLENNLGRKKSLPVNIVAKRSLVKGYMPTGSLENLLNDSSIENVSQLENVKPPSMMDEILDNGDMENSMLSVASITSEIADSKSQDDAARTVTLIPAITSITRNLGNNSAQNSLSEYLENINPPSLFNEISEIDDTTMDANTDTLCSDTLCIDNQLQTDDITFHVDDDKTYNDIDTDEGATPISTEYSSSAESTPKKVLKKQHLTPKQRRQLTKDRYRTYTIAAELKEGKPERLEKSSRHGTTPFTRLTPKQRRQEDPSRFQTQILNPFPQVANQQEKMQGSLIPSLKVTSVSRSTDIKQIESNTDSGVESQDNLQTTSEINSGDDIQSMLEQNANIVLYTLNESNKAKESLLDCETISLVSNDSETEKSLRIRFANIAGKKLNSETVNQQPVETQTVNEHDENKIEIGDDASGEASCDSESECQSKEKELRRPRIIKPIKREINADINTPKPESPKGIRGRKKPLYSNPNIKKSLQAPVANISNIPNSRNISPVVRTTRAMILKQNVNTEQVAKIPVPQKITSAVKNITLTKKSSIPQRKSITVQVNKSQQATKVNINQADTGAAVENQNTQVPKSLERQNTFTKDEPEMENAPTVQASPTKGKLTRAIRSPSAKGYSTKFKNTTKAQQPSALNESSKLIKCASAEKIAGPKVSAVQSKRHSSTEIGSKIASNINTNTLILKKPSVSYLRQRSNSNSSIVSHASETKKSIKEPISKIAMLWKKTDENKSRRLQKCKSEQCEATPEETSSGNKTPVCTSPTRLFRSSTFNGITSDVNIEHDECKRNFVTQAEVEILVRAHENSGNSSTSEAPCKIPVRYSSNPKVSDKSENRIIVPLRKQQSVIDTTNDDTSKRISRIGSFVRVDPTSKNSSNGADNQVLVPVLDYPPLRVFQTLQSFHHLNTHRGRKPQH